MSDSPLEEDPAGAHAAENTVIAGNAETVDTGAVEQNEPKKLQEQPLEEGKQQRGNKNIFRDVCSYILVTEFCERLAFYGLVGSLSIFLTREIKLSSAMASELGNTFSAINYLSPLLGAYLAETQWGRYKTIMYFCALYCVGMVMCTISAHPRIQSASLFFFGLFGAVAIGSGGIKPNVVVLGADQFDPAVPEEKEQMESYFNYFYWSINIGATFSFGFLAYMAVNGVGFISQEYGFFASFVIPTVAMAIAIQVFTMGSGKYIKKPPSGSALSTFTGVVLDAATVSRTGQLVVLGALAQIPGMVLVIVSFFVPAGVKTVLALMGTVFIVVGILALVLCGQSATWLNAARHGNGGNFSDDDVDDAADVVLLAPYFGFIVMFSCVYSQMSTTFILQGCQMDLRIGNGMMSSAQLNLFDCTIILVLIPIFDTYIYPAVAAAGHPVTPLRKIGVGYLFALLAMVVAAIVEASRKGAGLLDVQSNCNKVPMSDISVWWQTPQYILVGIAEILINIAAIDLFYSQAPESMRSVCQALNLLTQTAGGMVSAGLLSLMSSWFTDDLNAGHLEYIFMVFGLLVILNLGWFVQVSKGFVYKADRKHDRIEKIADESAGEGGDVEAAVDEGAPLLGGG